MDFLKGLFTQLFDFLKSIWDAFWGWVVQCWQWVATQFISFFQWVYDFWCWTFSYAIHYAQDLVWDKIKDAINDTALAQYLYFSYDIYDKVNYFLPFDELMVIVGILLATWTVCWVLKIVLKFIPTIY